MDLDTITCAAALDYLKMLPDNSVHCCVTSPPYFGLRSYLTGKWVGGDENCEHSELLKSQLNPGGTSATPKSQSHTRRARQSGERVCRLCGAIREDEQIGQEQSTQEYVANLVSVFREVRRVLRKDGTCWIVMGDSYAGSGVRSSNSGGKTKKQSTNAGSFVDVASPVTPAGYKAKDLMMIPARLAIALCDDGWYLRQEVVWAKNNPMPESVTDRVTRSHEWIYALEHGMEDDDEVGVAYTLSKQAKYIVDMAAIRESNTPDMRRRAAAGHTRGGTTESWDESRNDRENLAASREITANGRNARSVWTIPSSQSNYDYCRTCKSLFVGKERSRIQKTKVGVKTIKTCPNCGDTDSWIAHYAAFPAALVERMLLAGCPARVCDKCGAPWKRQHKKTGHVNAREEAHAPNSGPTKVDSTDWQPQSVPVDEFLPTCKCGSEGFDTGAVLDPFMGSGTTALVAQKFGRHYLGCDLSQDYVNLATARLVHAKYPPAVVKDDGVQLGLFEGGTK